MRWRGWTILAFDVIHRCGVILMACAFYMPEDLCSLRPHEYCR